MTTRNMILSVAAGSIAVLAGTALASSTNIEGVCAVTGDPNAPYTFVEIDPTQLAKADSDDIFGVTSASQCPTTLGGSLQSVSPSPSPSVSPSPTGQVLSAQTAASPAVLPDTGGSAR